MTAVSKPNRIPPKEATMHVREIYQTCALTLRAVLVDSGRSLMVDVFQSNCIARRLALFGFLHGFQTPPAVPLHSWQVERAFPHVTFQSRRPRAITVQIT